MQIDSTQQQQTLEPLAFEREKIAGTLSYEKEREEAEWYKIGKSVSSILVTRYGRIFVINVSWEWVKKIVKKYLSNT